MKTDNFFIPTVILMDLIILLWVSFSSSKQNVDLFTVIVLITTLLFVLIFFIIWSINKKRWY
jgi:hypothetical protein